MSAVRSVIDINIITLLDMNFTCSSFWDIESEKMTCPEMTAAQTAQIR